MNIQKEIAPLALSPPRPQNAPEGRRAWNILARWLEQGVHEKMASLDQPRARESLSSKVVEKLREDILSGVYSTGEKLPTEPELVEKFGVSRTVLREAIAALRADGLVEPRHGVGVFVREPKDAVPGLHLLTQIHQKISDIIEELELRASVEIEAAGLAAERCSPAQEAEIQAQLDRFAALKDAGQPTAQADFEFHMAVARATNNARFEEFLAYLGRRTIPRSKLNADKEAENWYKSRDAHLHGEHIAVAEAIYARDPEKARDAMRVHLVGSLQRYRVMTRRGKSV